MAPAGFYNWYGCYDTKHFFMMFPLIYLPPTHVPSQFAYLFVCYLQKDCVRHQFPFLVHWVLQQCHCNVCILCLFRDWDIVTCCLRVVQTQGLGLGSESGSQITGRLGFSKWVAVLTLLSHPVFSYGWRAHHETQWRGEWQGKWWVAMWRTDMKGFYSSDV